MTLLRAGLLALIVILERDRANKPSHRPSPITSWQIDGETVETVADFIFWAPKSLQVVTEAMKLKDAYSLEGKL